MRPEITVKRAVQVNSRTQRVKHSARIASSAALVLSEVVAMVAQAMALVYSVLSDNFKTALNARTALTESFKVQQGRQNVRYAPIVLDRTNFAKVAAVRAQAFAPYVLLASLLTVGGNARTAQPASIKIKKAD